MQRDSLQVAQPAVDRVVERVRSAVDSLVGGEAAAHCAGPAGAVRYRIHRNNLMAEPAVLAAIGSALSVDREETDARRAALSLDLYSLGLAEAHRACIARHASHPQRPMWLADGVRDQRLALWMYAACRMLVEDTSAARVFLEDLGEALLIPVRDIRYSGRCCRCPHRQAEHPLLCASREQVSRPVERVDAPRGRRHSRPITLNSPSDASWSITSLIFRNQVNGAAGLSALDDGVLERQRDRSDVEHGHAGQVQHHHLVVLNLSVLAGDGLGHAEDHRAGEVERAGFGRRRLPANVAFPLHQAAPRHPHR